jgi:hypothetical protein
MPTQDDIMSVLGLAKSINSEIHEFNRNNMDHKANINIITPQNIVKNVVLPNTPMPQPPPMMDVNGVGVSAPAPLIPLAEAFPDGKIPEGYGSAYTAPAPVNVAVPQPIEPPKNDNQMEFTFLERLKQNPDSIKTIIQRFDDLEHKIILLDAKITNLFNNLLNRKRRKKDETNDTVA